MHDKTNRTVINAVCQTFYSDGQIHNSVLSKHYLAANLLYVQKGHQCGIKESYDERTNLPAFVVHIHAEVPYFFICVDFCVHFFCESASFKDIFKMNSQR